MRYYILVLRMHKALKTNANVKRAGRQVANCYYDKMYATKTEHVLILVPGVGPGKIAPHLTRLSHFKIAPIFFKT